VQKPIDMHSIGSVDGWQPCSYWLSKRDTDPDDTSMEEMKLMDMMM
jgi:hypothetical protein